jgi:hypothetical protein
MREIEASLENEFPVYSRIWVQYSQKGNYHLCLTLFPRDNSLYKMVFGEVNTLSQEKISNILQNYLVKQK